MSILRGIALSLVLALGALPLAACGSSKAGAGASTTAGATSAAGVTALASKIGVPESIVNSALDAAKSALGAGSKTDADKTTAAQAGVDKASAEATAQGKPLTDDQKSGLLEGVKGMI